VEHNQDLCSFIDDFVQIPTMPLDACAGTAQSVISLAQQPN
jgi:hypothetical protein